MSFDHLVEQRAHTENGSKTKTLEVDVVPSFCKLRSDFEEDNIKSSSARKKGKNIVFFYRHFDYRHIRP